MYICSASGELVHPAWVGEMARHPQPSHPESSPASQQPQHSQEAPSLDQSNAVSLERGSPVHSL